MVLWLYISVIQDLIGKKFVIREQSCGPFLEYSRELEKLSKVGLHYLFEYIFCCRGIHFSLAR